MSVYTDISCVYRGRKTEINPDEFAGNDVLDVPNKTNANGINRRLIIVPASTAN